MLGDGEPLGRARGIGISAGGVGDDRDAHRIGIGLGRADIALRGLDATADAAEQVDFVGDVEPGIDVIGRSRSELRPRRGRVFRWH